MGCIYIHVYKTNKVRGESGFRLDQAMDSFSHTSTTPYYTKSFIFVSQLLAFGLCFWDEILRVAVLEM